MNPFFEFHREALDPQIRENVRKTLRFSSLQKWKTERPQAKDFVCHVQKSWGLLRLIK